MMNLPGWMLLGKTRLEVISQVSTKPTWSAKAAQENQFTWRAFQSLPYTDLYSVLASLMTTRVRGSWPAVQPQQPQSPISWATSCHEAAGMWREHRGQLCAHRCSTIP